MMKGLCYGLLGGLAGLLNAVFDKEHPDAGISIDDCLRRRERAMCLHTLDCLLTKRDSTATGIVAAFGSAAMFANATSLSASRFMIDNEIRC